MTQPLFKVLSADGKSCNGGNLQWSLPTWTGRTWKPGKWLPRIDNIIPCERGYHVCKPEHLLHWLGPSIWRVEIAPNAETIDHGDKLVTTGPVRLVAGTAWSDEVARLFAVACAVDVLPLYEREPPHDLHISDALVTAWEYAHGFATDAELTAASAGTCAAAVSGAWAASAAARAASAAASAAVWDAAWAAASAAARAAAWDAAWAAASATASDAQTDRLMRYLEGEVDI